MREPGEMDLEWKLDLVEERPGLGPGIGPLLEMRSEKKVFRRFAGT